MLLLPCEAFNDVLIRKYARKYARHYMTYENWRQWPNQGFLYWGTSNLLAPLRKACRNGTIPALDSSLVEVCGYQQAMRLAPSDARKEGLCNYLK